MTQPVGTLGFNTDDVVRVRFQNDGTPDQSVLRVYSRGDKCPHCKDGTFLLETEELINGKWRNAYPKCERWMRQHAYSVTPHNPVRVRAVLSYGVTVNADDMESYRQTGLMPETLRTAILDELRGMSTESLMDCIEEVKQS